jgi:hypothetical protein
MLRTFNPGWQNEVPELAHIMSDKHLETESKIRAMQQALALREKFRLYEQYVKALAEHHHLRTWGCSFEVSMNAVAAGRVHCHDCIGPAIDAISIVD